MKNGRPQARYMKKRTVKTPNIKSPTAKIVQLPSISRFFTEWRMIIIVISVFLGLSLLVLGTVYVKSMGDLRDLEKARAGIQKELVFWEKVVEKHTDYRDAFMNVSLLQYQLGDMDGAKKSLEKALALDPNFAKARELQKILAK